MRLKELLSEETLRKEIADDALDWLSAYKLKGVEKAPMSGPGGMISYLEKLGYHSIDPVLVMDMLSSPRFSGIVKRSTPEEIYLHVANPSSDAPQSEMEKSKEKVMKGAAKGAEKMVKDRKSTRLNSSHIQKSRMPSSA